MWRIGGKSLEAEDGWCAGAWMCVQVRVVKGKREPAVARHLVTHGWVSKDNCRYQPVPISLMWTCGIMETAFSQRREIEKREEEINASEEFGEKIRWTGLIWGSVLYISFFSPPVEIHHVMKGWVVDATVRAARSSGPNRTQKLPYFKVNTFRIQYNSYEWQGVAMDKSCGSQSTHRIASLLQWALTTGQNEFCVPCSTTEISCRHTNEAFSGVWCRKWNTFPWQARN